MPSFICFYLLFSDCEIKSVQYADYFYTNLIKLTDDEHTCVVSHFKSLWMSDTCFWLIKIFTFLKHTNNEPKSIDQQTKYNFIIDPIRGICLLK